MSKLQRKRIEKTGGGLVTLRLLPPPPQPAALPLLTSLSLLLAFLLPAGLAQAQGGGAKPVKLTLRSDGTAQGVPGRYALIVAVDDYLPPVKPLQYCVKGAQELKQVLIDHGGFPAQNITELYNPLGTAERKYGAQDATRANIYKWIAELQYKQPPAELALVYFSGHGMLLDTDNPDGTQAGKESYCYMNVDANPDPLLAESTFVNIYEVTNNLENLTRPQNRAGFTPLQRAVVFVDACQHYQRSFFKDDGAKGQYITSVNFSAINPGARGLVGMTSCSPLQASWEDNYLQNGVFTHFLVRALKGEAGADKDNNGTLDFLEVAAHVQLNVSHWSQMNRDRAMTPLPIGRAEQVPLTVIRVPTTLTARQQAERALKAGLEHQQARRLDEARLSYQAAARLDPSWAWTYNYLGLVCGDLKRYDEAIASYKEAIRLDPQSAPPYNNLGRVYYDLKRYDEAIASFREATRLDPQAPYQHSGLGDVYHDLKRYDEAIASYKEAIRLDPQYAIAHNNLGNVYLDLKRYDEAMARLEEAIRLDPHLAMAHHNVGGIYYYLERYNDAIASFKEAIRLDPQFAKPHNGLGYVYKSLERYDEALASYKEALRFDPQYATAHNGLGSVYYALERYHEAMVSFKEAIRLDPQDATAHAGLGLACFLLGDYDAAITSFHEAIRLDPAEQVYKDGLQLLQDTLAKRN